MQNGASADVTGSDVLVIHNNNHSHARDHSCHTNQILSQSMLRLLSYWCVSKNVDGPTSLHSGCWVKMHA